MSKDYLLDGEPIDFYELVQVAQKEGYYEPSGLYLTSAAARVLRGNGHTVEDNKVTAK